MLHVSETYTFLLYPHCSIVTNVCSSYLPKNPKGTQMEGETTEADCLQPLAYASTYEECPIFCEGCPNMRYILVEQLHESYL